MNVSVKLIFTKMKISTKKTSFYILHLFLYRIFTPQIIYHQNWPAKISSFYFLFVKITLLNLFPRIINNLEICVKFFFFISTYIEINTENNSFCILLCLIFIIDVYSC